METQIPAFLEINSRLATGGYPSREQLADIAQAGYRVVINLATSASAGWLADEGTMLEQLGVKYHHIPVDWQEPKREDFAAFCDLMAQHASQRVFVHCQANMRVSAFVFIYRVRQLGDDRTWAERDLLSIWTPNERWQAYIGGILAAPRDEAS
jgi:uncharacterized protein (TIGR01244 family)